MKIKILILLAICYCGFCCDKDNLNPQTTEPNISLISQKIYNVSNNLSSYCADINSLYAQPLLEAVSVRTGKIVYIKDANSSELLIDFFTRKDDDNTAVDDRQKYIFDGIWLWRINYQTKHIDKRQIAQKGKPQDAMLLISKNFPLIGFAQNKPLEEDFFVETAQEPNSIILKLIPKTDNPLAQSYTKIICDIDIKSYLPKKIKAFTIEEDYYEITMDNPNVNISIDKSIFDFNAPSDFTIQTTYLDKD